MLAFIDAEESTVGGGFFNECWGDLSRVQFATHLWAYKTVLLFWKKQAVWSSYTNPVMSRNIAHLTRIPINRSGFSCNVTGGVCYYCSAEKIVRTKGNILCAIWYVLSCGYTNVYKRILYIIIYIFIYIQYMIFIISKDMYIHTLWSMPVLYKTSMLQHVATMTFDRQMIFALAFSDSLKWSWSISKHNIKI